VHDVADEVGMRDPAPQTSLRESEQLLGVPANPDAATLEKMLGKPAVRPTDDGSSFERLRNEFERGEVLRALTVVIPMYRESKRIGVTIETLAKSKLHRDGISFCFVDDGSTDDTIDVARAAIERFQLSNAEILPLKQNVGKGGAVRAGILHVAADSHIVGYVDADLSLDPAELLTGVARLRLSKADALVGERIVDSAKQPKARRLASLAFRRLATSLVPTGVRDSQCAMKLFRSDVAVAIFNPLSTFGFAFDVEILGRLKRDGYVVRESPVLWEHQPGSQIATGSDGFKMLRELFIIRSVLGRPATTPTPNLQSA
jgi:glycosyltransferase involved in cell wall biosynthesis